MEMLGEVKKLRKEFSMLKSISTAAAASCLMIIAGNAQVQASDESDAAAAALVLLGAAALAHHEDHHRNGKHLTQAEAIEAFDRGYSDGLHNEAHNSRGMGADYNDGFAAGHKERENRLAAKRNNHGKNGTPIIAMRTCVGEASAKWDRNPRDIVVIKSRKLGSNDFLVEVGVGHKHGSCEVSKSGEIYLFKNGRI
jgi:hypothetical protein